VTRIPAFARVAARRDAESSDTLLCLPVDPAGSSDHSRYRLERLVGGSYDNALAETIDGPYWADVIHRRGLWRSFEAVLFATLG
jgi:hypothetical protein